MALKQTITREQLKHQIGEEAIFKHYFGDFTLQTAYNSPLREDKKASTGFFLNKNNSIVYNDFATGEKYDFVHFVMKLHNLNYYAALQHIAANFGLLNSGAVGSKVAIIKPLNQLKKPLKKAIIVNATRFKKEHLTYWLQYGITEQELKQAGIYAVSSFTINKIDDAGRVVQTFTSSQNNELKFAYTFTDADKTYIKLYTPFSKDYKWAGDVKLDICFGINDLPIKNTNKLIVTKSVKDCLVLRKFLPECVGLQNESFQAIDMELFTGLKKLYKNIILFGDNDKRGLEFCEEVKQLGWQAMHFPPQFKEKYNVKDPSDFVKHFGLAVFEEYLEHIKLI